MKFAVSNSKNTVVFVTNSRQEAIEKIHELATDSEEYKFSFKSTADNFDIAYQHWQQFKVGEKLTREIYQGHSYGHQGGNSLIF